MKKVIFVRVPRTASTNFTGVLEKIYKPKIIRDLVWQQMPAKERTEKLKKGRYFYDFDNMAYPAKNIRSYDAIEGHFLAKKYVDLKDEYKFVTFLRDPVERVISHFNIIISRQDRLGIDIKKFAEIYKNFHSIMIGNPDDFEFIGITEMFRFSTWLFYKNFKIPKEKRLNIKKRKRIRTVGKKRKVSKQERKYIKEINAEDYELYNHVKEKMKEQENVWMKKQERRKKRVELRKKQKVESRRKNDKTKNIADN